jgi:site-specific DNA-methyltransferase (adenine-specific)
MLDNIRQYPTGTFFSGDCFEYMASLPDHSVDMILADLPYGIVNWTNPYAWDTAMDMKRLFAEYLRIVKPKSAIVLFGTEPYSSFQRTVRPELFKYDIVWLKNKVSSPYLAKVKPLRSLELISVFSEGTTAPGRKNNMPYYPQGLIHKPRKVKNSMKDRMVFQARPSTMEEYTQEYTNYPKDFVSFPCETGMHPTQKPVTLFEYLIKTYTLPGQTVLDNTAGSGTTAIAAMNTDRRWHCCEQDAEYFAKANERVEQNESRLKALAEPVIPPEKGGIDFGDWLN